MKKNESKNRLFLIDALALIYHAYRNSSKSPLYSVSGANVSTINGFFLMLKRILLSQNPTHIAVAFDIKKPTFRHFLSEKYKAHRKSMPNDIQYSLPIIKKILTLMNIQAIEKEGYEADDIIGTLAKKASSENFTVYIVSPDKDFLQLVDDTIFICKLNKPGKELKYIGITEVRNRFAVANASQITEIMALCGDASDNIPGISGLGNRNARKLIQQFGSIEGIFNNIENLNAKHKEIFTKYRAELEISKKLVTINTDVPLQVSLDCLKINPIYESDLLPYLCEYNLQHLINI